LHRPDQGALKTFFDFMLKALRRCIFGLAARLNLVCANSLAAFDCGNFGGRHD